MEHNVSTNYLVSMIIVPIIAGLLGTMNMWVVKWNHTKWHLNDVYMVTLMTCWMIILGYMLTCDGMGTSANLLIGIIILTIWVIYLIRTQTFIDDKQFLNGMIPHHSMALLMADRIKGKTKDPRIIKLADGIIKSQIEEINVMENILKTK